MRVIAIEDGETLFNAFEERNFTRRQRGNDEVRVPSRRGCALHSLIPPGSRRAPSEGGAQVVVGDHMVVDVDWEGVPVGIDVYQNASKVVDLSRLEAEGPVFGLIPARDTRRRAG